LLLAGCGGEASAEGPGGGGAAKATADGDSRAPESDPKDPRVKVEKSLTADDRSALEAFRGTLAAHWIKIDDSWTTQLQSRDMTGRVSREVPTTTHKQVKEFKFRIRPSELNDADKLNGVDYRAEIETEDTSYRFFHRVKTDFGDPAGWTVWKSTKDLMSGQRLSGSVERMNGEWKIQGSTDLVSGKKPDPAMIPANN
jgi:hypothetical protein